MISDVIFEALREIDSYMDSHHSLYTGETREIIDELRAHMNGVLLFLDTPPGNRAGTDVAEQNGKVKTNVKTV